MTKIPLVCLSYNQPTYLQQLILHWRFYHPNEETHPIYIFDNGSTSQELLNLWEYYWANTDINIVQYSDNNFIPNLTDFINKYIKLNYQYYVLSDCDIQPHPSTPWNYLDVFKHLIDSGYHRAGFGLITDDLPDYLHLRDCIANYEQGMLNKPFQVNYEGKEYTGYKCPLDTTFCLYKTRKGGWSAPMNERDWNNCARIFRAFHMPFYLDEERLNPEMTYYFETAKRHVPGEPSAGASSHRPKKYS